MRILCIDFETANRFVGSICAVGIAIIENGEILDSKEWLIKPHPDYNYFHPINTRIHGIRKEDVINAPEFNEVYSIIQAYFKDSILAAHNAAFDMSCLRHVLDLYDLPCPEIQYFCTYKAASKTWDRLENHKLNTVCGHIGFNFKHHNAKEDAIACGKVLLASLAENRVDNPALLADTIGMRVGKLYPGGYEACSIAAKKTNIGKKV
ncbi:3'-5' exonuclease [Herbivorax sp. ANBcel31]|uniref:3'-5' exonuclease n=1 Tax=Herbivorax sp. ANBcel31 TaxID=3069754 RepID=UPI0027AF561F|nr:3'-5' exonuclease [Herbivorax sp. ANBcel31]MDQ2085821.1 3'-5' exonuclease [Herbivorax sp. ANBcel31]